MASFSDMKSMDGLLGYAPINPDAPKHQPLELSLDDRQARRQRRRRRFLAAFAVSAFIWLAAHAIFRSNMFKSCFHGKPKHLKLKSVGGWEYAIPHELALEHCVQSDEWSKPEMTADGRLSSESSFDLALPSENLLVFSRGHWSNGALNVVTSPEQAQDTATVRVEVKYFREEIRDLAKVCYITRAEGEQGVGIFTPTWDGRRPRRWRDNMIFETTFTLPEVEAGSAPLQIKKFETDVHNTVHGIGDLNQKILFDSLSLQGTNGPINVQSLLATSGSIHTTNGPIKGIFNTTKSLIIETSNSPIGVDVGLESDKDGSQPVLSVLTNNSPVKASISLSSVSSSGGAFNVTTTTSNGPLTLNFPASPVDSKLTLGAKTSNSPATVSLNPAYEGTFKLRTSTWFKAEANFDKAVIDPSGKDRKRSVFIIKPGRGSLSGSVKWGPMGGHGEVEGAVDVSTSNSHVMLNL